MAEENTGSGEVQQPAAASWKDDTQEALNRTIDALQVAWDATRETRLAALNSARRTVAELTDAVEEGISAANARWAATQPGDATPEPAPSTETDESDTDEA
jgi:hypothetical protein